MKTIVVLLLTLGTAISTLGQSTVVFSGRVVDSQTAQPVSSPDFRVSFYWAPGATIDQHIFVQLGADSTIAANGTFSSGTRTVPTVGPSSPYSFYAAAWETAFGSSYEAASQVQGARVGKSQVVTVNLPGPPPGPAQVNFGTFEVSPVPEPSTIALVLLGLGSLLMIRRRAT